MPIASRSLSPQPPLRSCSREGWRAGPLLGGRPRRLSVFPAACVVVCVVRPRRPAAAPPFAAGGSSGKRRRPLRRPGCPRRRPGCPRRRPAVSSVGVVRRRRPASASCGVVHVGVRRRRPAAGGGVDWRRATAKTAFDAQAPLRQRRRRNGQIDDVIVGHVDKGRRRRRRDRRRRLRRTATKDHDEGGGEGSGRKRDAAGGRSRQENDDAGGQRRGRRRGRRRSGPRRGSRALTPISGRGHNERCAERNRVVSGGVARAGRCGRPSCWTRSSGAAGASSASPAGTRPTFTRPCPPMREVWHVRRWRPACTPRARPDPPAGHPIPLAYGTARRPPIPRADGPVRERRHGLQPVVS